MSRQDLDDADAQPVRTPAQFFFEVGYAACFAESMIRNGMKAPFELTDEHIQVAWPLSIEAHEDGSEMDRYLALAEAAPDLLAAAKVAVETLAPQKDDDFVWATMTQLFRAISKATGEA